MTTSIGGATFLYHGYKDIDYPGPWTNIDWITCGKNLPDTLWLRNEYDYERPKSLSRTFENYLHENPWAFWVFAATAHYLSVVTDATRIEWAVKKNAADVLAYINANGAPNRKKELDHTGRMPASGAKHVLPDKYAALFARMWNLVVNDDPNFRLPLRERAPRKHTCPECGTIFTGYGFILARPSDANYNEALAAYEKQKAIDKEKEND